MLDHLSAHFQSTCEQVEHELTSFVKTPPAEVVLNIVGTEDILRRAALLVRQARQHLSLMGGSPELIALEPDLQAAVERGISARIVSVGPAPAVAGQVVTYPGENASSPT